MDNIYGVITTSNYHVAVGREVLDLGKVIEISTSDEEDFYSVAINTDADYLLHIKKEHVAIVIYDANPS